jgi:hypothetical protein
MRAIVVRLPVIVMQQRLQHLHPRAGLRVQNGTRDMNLAGSIRASAGFTHWRFPF